MKSNNLTKRDYLVALVFIAFTLTAMRCTAQAISITQDARLALVGDDKGNEAFTPNLRGKLLLTGFENEIGYTSVNLTYEWADLQGGDYTRYGVQAGYTFYTFVDSIELTPLVGYGVIVRHGFSTQSWEFELQGVWWFSDHFGLMGSMYSTDRTDLEQSKYITSGSIGLIARL